MNTPLLIEVYHPGIAWAVIIRPDSFSGFAVYRPAYSARGNTANAVRLVRPSLDLAPALAFKPFSARTAARLPRRTSPTEAQ